MKKLLTKYLGKLTFSHGTIQTALAANRAGFAFFLFNLNIYFMKFKIAIYFLSQDEDIEIFDTNTMLANQINNTNEIEPSSSSAQQISSAEPDISASLRAKKSDISHAKTLLILISNQLSLIRMRYKEKDIQSKNKSDWNLIACVLDRFCLIVYSVIMFLGLFIIFI